MEECALDGQGCKAATPRHAGYDLHPEFPREVYLALYLSRNSMELGYVEASSQRFKPHKRIEHRMLVLGLDQAFITTSA